MDYSKPVVTIDLEEYNELIKKKTKILDIDIFNLNEKIIKGIVILLRRDVTQTGTNILEAISFISKGLGYRLEIEMQTENKPLDEIGIKYIKL